MMMYRLYDDQTPASTEIPFTRRAVQYMDVVPVLEAPAPLTGPRGPCPLQRPYPFPRSARPFLYRQDGDWMQAHCPGWKQKLLTYRPPAKVPGQRSPEGTIYHFRKMMNVPLNTIVNEMDLPIAKRLALHVLINGNKNYTYYDAYDEIWLERIFEWDYQMMKYDYVSDTGELEYLPAFVHDMLVMYADHINYRYHRREHSEHKSVVEHLEMMQCQGWPAWTIRQVWYIHSCHSRVLADVHRQLTPKSSLWLQYDTPFIHTLPALTAPKGKTETTGKYRHGYFTSAGHTGETPFGIENISPLTPAWGYRDRLPYRPECQDRMQQVSHHKHPRRKYKAVPTQREEWRTVRCLCSWMWRWCKECNKNTHDTINCRVYHRRMARNAKIKKYLIYALLGFVSMAAVFMLVYILIEYLRFY